MGLVLVTAPAEEPVTLQEAIQHCRVDEEADYPVMEALIVAAREYVETFCRRALVTQTWDYTMDGLPEEILVPKPPLQSVTSITYVDVNGTSQTLASTEYQVNTKDELGRIRPAYSKSWPSYREAYNAITVRFVAGYGVSAAVPKALKQAMLLLIGHWFENREPMPGGGFSMAAQGQSVQIPFAVDALLWQHRVLRMF